MQSQRALLNGVTMKKRTCKLVLRAETLQALDGPRSLDQQALARAFGGDDVNPGGVALADKQTYAECIAQR